MPQQSNRREDHKRVHEGDRVKIGGIELRVAGVYDPQRFDREVKTLGGDPIGPLKYASGALDVGGRQLSDATSVESLEVDARSAAGEAAVAGAAVAEAPLSNGYALFAASRKRRLLP